MSLEPPLYLSSLQNNIRARPIPWEGAVRAGNISDEQLKKVKAVDKVRKEARRSTVEADQDGYVCLLAGSSDGKSILESAAKRTDIVQYMLVLATDLITGKGRSIKILERCVIRDMAQPLTLRWLLAWPCCRCSLVGVCFGGAFAFRFGPLQSLPTASATVGQRRRPGAASDLNLLDEGVARQSGKFVQACGRGRGGAIPAVQLFIYACQEPGQRLAGHWRARVFRFTTNNGLKGGFLGAEEADRCSLG